MYIMDKFNIFFIFANFCEFIPKVYISLVYLLLLWKFFCIDNSTEKIAVT